MVRIDRSLALSLTRWQYPGGLQGWMALVGVAALIAATALLVWQTGGIQYAFSHIMYLPVLLGAALFGPPGGVLAGLAGGLALGPWMPIDTASGEMQEPLNWIYRTAFFMFVGGVVGMLGQAVARLLGEDPVSGAPSQQPLRQDLGRTLDPPVPGRTPNRLSVLVVIFDNYTELVHTFGPEVGVRLIRGLVGRLQAACGAEARVYHLHGERFAVVVDQQRLEAVRACIREQAAEPLVAGGVPLYVNLTFGRADYPEHGRHAEQLIQCATIAGDLATRQGERERVYDASSDQSSRENLVLLSGFRRALAGGELCLHHQPKWHLGRERVTGTEALLRWQHPEHGLLTPVRFIPQLENSHLIHELTPWVVRAALRDLADLQARSRDWQVAMNLSARNLNDDGLLGDMERALGETGTSPEQLEVEVTESAVLADPDRASRVLGRLRDWGVGVAIDDFGAGQTSLGYLRRLPASTLKIDRSLICQLAPGSSDHRIVESVAGLGRRLGMEVVAEGVEDRATLEAVRRAGCDAVQGYGVCPPRPLETVCANWAPRVERRAGRAIRSPGEGAGK
ncbi:putative bifunctional diguanylate cyclase/phosphodiesterase [Halorhodospira halophila]|uniref:Diguanylate cyclase/phosphodiesterase n=1 Tax=Halorhodospira halophila (strain DSM 244 / SL1) TaxID=349124 RepID=A1WTW5_HALHL|nr:GGDEF domain-containing phosphodiesterase [Halorhodospira halophila]ABM61127.1 diguanylate cyclase/phosphodiesterase [Halorhodospira halophila SL1]MBK1729679.1 GGDEF domain-containing protein [Halorhodospira halophila]